MAVTKPLSNRRSDGPALGCLAVFFGLFLLAGCAACYFTLVLPLTRYISSRSWTETTCTVLESRVGESSSDDGSTYRVEVVYTYSFGGRGYRSDRYGVFDAYTSGYDGKAEIVARYPPGARVYCWVDPAHPESSILSRAPTWEWLFGLFSLPFLLVGGGGLVWLARSSRREKAKSALPVPAPASPFGIEPSGRATTDGFVELRPALSPMGKLLGLGVATVFWNGLVSVFVWQAVAGWKRGAGDGCLTLFLVPFVLVGLGLILGTCRQFLVLFNPRVRITLSPGVLTAGESVFVQWRFEGRASRVRRLTLLLEGREEAQYRRGTSTYTDRSVFATLTVMDTTDSFFIAGGSTTFSLPADTVPSFQAGHNKIAWTLKVSGEIAGWPDSDEDYEVLVQPGGGAR